MPPRHRVRGAPCAAWSGVAPGLGKPGVPRRLGLPEPSPRRRGGGRGLEVSPRGLSQNLLVQRQVRYRLAQPAVLKLQLFQVTLIWIGFEGITPSS